MYGLGTVVLAIDEKAEFGKELQREWSSKNWWRVFYGILSFFFRVLVVLAEFGMGFGVE